MALLHILAEDEVQGVIRIVGFHDANFACSNDRQWGMGYDIDFADEAYQPTLANGASVRCLLGATNATIIGQVVLDPATRRHSLQSLQCRCNFRRRIMILTSSTNDACAAVMESLKALATVPATSKTRLWGV